MKAKPAPARARRESNGPYTITQLAQEFDITPRAIRFYEDVGLLDPAREGRNRVYTHRDRTRLKLTLRGKRLGLTLQEIKQLVDMYDSPDDTAPQLQAFLAVLQAHRDQLEQQLEDIEVTLAEISQHEERCRSLLSAAAALAKSRSSARVKPRAKPRAPTPLPAEPPATLDPIECAKPMDRSGARPGAKPRAKSTAKPRAKELVQA